MNDQLDDKELQTLRRDLQDEIAGALHDLLDDEVSTLYGVQPLSAVIEEAARAAVCVLLAFERGSRVTG